MNKSPLRKALMFSGAELAGMTGIFVIPLVAAVVLVAILALILALSGADGRAALVVAGVMAGVTISPLLFGGAYLLALRRQGDKRKPKDEKRKRLEVPEVGASSEGFTDDTTHSRVGSRPL